VNVNIGGIGWVTPSGIGRGRPGETLTLGPGRLPSLKSRMFLDVVHPRFGRFDSYAKAGFGAIALALRSAGLDRWTHKRAIGAIVSTRRGCLEADLAYFQTAVPQGGSLASPNLFAYTLPGTMLGEASIQFGLTGPSLVVDDSDGHLAGVYTALDLMQSGFCDAAVAGWCDVSSKILNADSQEPCGAVFFVLTQSTEAASWRWHNRELTWGTQRAVDLGGLARRVLTDKRGTGNGSE
jgi:3-oxoacyl-[acyl-carrier-protein] synthase II